jgi:hypothetical protein
MCVVAAVGCADIIGAEFDVDPLGAGGNSTTSSGTGGSGPSACPPGATDLVIADKPYGIAAGRSGDAAGWVYFTELASTGPRVRRIRSDGSAPPELVAEGLERPSRIVVNESYAYFPDAGTDGGQNGRILRASIATNEVVTLVEDLRSPHGIAVDSENVYFTTGAEQDQDSFVYSHPAAGAPGAIVPFALAPKGTIFLAIAGDGGSNKVFGTTEVAPPRVWFKGIDDGLPPDQIVDLDTTAMEFRPSTVRARQNGVVVVSFRDGKAMTFDLNLEHSGPLGDGMGQLGDLAVEGEVAYWADFSEGLLWKNGAYGGTKIPLFSLPNANGVASDGQALYVAQHQDSGAICRTPLGSL